MSQRPDILKVLNRAVAVITEQSGKLSGAVDASLEAIEQSTTLTSDDIGAYKDAVRTAQKLITAFTRVNDISLPAVKFSPAKRGRPPKVRASDVKAAPAKKAAAAAPKAKAVKAAVVAPVAVVAKKRGRPAKVAAAPVAVVAEAPKKRGRPAKAKPEATQAAPVVSQDAPKKRGRPRKVVDVDPVTVALN